MTTGRSLQKIAFLKIKGASFNFNNRIKLAAKKIHFKPGAFLISQNIDFHIPIVIKKLSLGSSHKTR